MRKILIFVAVVACIMASLAGCMPNQPAPAPTAIPEVAPTLVPVEPAMTPAPLVTEETLVPEEPLVPAATVVPDNSI